MTETAYQKCINPDCGAQFDCGQSMFKCPACGELLDIRYDWDKIEVPGKLSDFGKRWAGRDNRLDFSGVWRFRELLSFCEDQHKVSIGEGQTILQQNDGVAEYVDIQAGRLHLQYEGLNPSGSFKDNGMTAAFSQAHVLRPATLPRRWPCTRTVAASSARSSSARVESHSANSARRWITALRRSRFSATSTTA